MKTKVYAEIAVLLSAIRSCEASGKSDWKARHKARVRRIIENHLPHGSGFDNGVKIDLDASTSEKLVFLTSFHHMNDHGMYIGWTEHKVIVTPSLAFGYAIKVTGPNKRDIRSYISEMFGYGLSEHVGVCDDVLPPEPNDVGAVP